MSKKIYLSGRYQGCTSEEANGWRDKAKKLLGEKNVVIPHKVCNYKGMTNKECQDLVHQDIKQLFACDGLLLNAWSPGWGSGCELNEAYNMYKDICVVATGDVSPWLRVHASHLVSTVEEACEWFIQRYNLKVDKPVTPPNAVPYPSLTGLQTLFDKYWTSTKEINQTCKK